MDCYLPGRVCVFPQPSSDGETFSREELELDHEGVESTFRHTAAAHLESIGRERPDLAEELSLRIHGLPGNDFFVLRVREGREEWAAAQLQERHARIEFACPDYLLAPAAVRSLDPPTSTSSGVDELLLAYPRAPGPGCGRGLRIAVVDSGVDDRRFSLAGGLSFDAFASLATPPARGDVSGHGTAVAAVINQMAPGAELVSVRVFSRGFGSLSSLVNGLLLAALARADIVNLSIAGRPGSCAQCGRLTATSVELALLMLARAHDPSPLVIAAAGNHEGEAPLAFPAAVAGVVAVGSLEDAQSSRARYRQIDPGRFFLAPDGSQSPQGHWRGTSFSCAAVSGIAARHGCNFDAQCQTPQPAYPGESRSTFMLRRMAETADRSFAEYDATQHGCGVARAV